jgi:hypothetical protein
MEPRRFRDLGLVLAAIAALIGLALRVDLGDLPEVTLFRDDAYYGFTWVRSLVQGRGPVISEDVWTSGVHPLWCLLLTVPAFALGPDCLPVVARVLGLGLHGGTAALLVLGPGRRSRGGLLVGLIYLGNPVLITEAQNGQETALACFVLLLLWQTRRAGVSFLAVSVLAVLTRSDLFGVVVALNIWRHRLGLRSAAASIGVLLPLLAFNLGAGGGWGQDSAWAIPWLFQQNFLASDPSLVAHLERLWWYLRPCLLGGPFALVSPWWAGVFVFAVLRGPWPRALRWLPLAGTAAGWILGAEDVLVPLVASVLLALAPAPGRRPWPRDLVALGIGLWLVVVAHELWRAYPRNYYFVPLGIAGALALLPLARGRWRGFLLPVALVQVWAAMTPVTEQRPWQEEMAMAGRLLDRVLRSRELVGCFNGGLVTWYRPDRVVNLDGRVNRVALVALQQGKLAGYMDELDLRFVLDTPVQFALRDPLADQWPHASGSYFGNGFDPGRDLREIVRFDIPDVGGGIPGTDSFRLYWRVGVGPPPALEPGFADLGPASGGGRFLRWSGPRGSVLTFGSLDRPELRRTVARGEDGVVLVLRLTGSDAGPTGLFESGRERPLLTFPPL